MQAIWRRISATCAVAAASVAFVPAASAAITPTVTLDQSAGTAAGSTVNLGTDLKFAPTGSDSPKDLTLKLPAGLLANASIDGGACLRNAAGAQPVPACQGIELPRGLSFARRRVNKRLMITGVSVKGAQIRSLVLGGGKLTVTLRRPVSSLSVKLAPAALRESRWLRQRAKHHQIKSLKLTVVVRNVNHKSTTATLQIANLQL